jgi:hypothetical protein
MSETLAHDLASPLHAAQYWSTELAEATDLEQVEAYLPRAAASIQKAIALLKPLRPKLDLPHPNTPEYASFWQAHQLAMRLTQIHNKTRDFPPISIQIDSTLKDLTLKLDITDLVQILDQIYFACRKATSIHVLLSNVLDTHIEISIRAKCVQFNRDDLGILLAQKIVEGNHGKITVNHLPDQPGSVYTLTLNYSHSSSVEPTVISLMRKEAKIEN